MSRLVARSGRPHNGRVDDEEATTLILEALFEIRGRVRDIHYAVLEDDNGEEEETEDDA